MVLTRKLYCSGHMEQETWGLGSANGHVPHHMKKPVCKITSDAKWRGKIRRKVVLAELNSSSKP